MWGRAGIVVLAALVVVAGAGGASARQLPLGRCVRKTRARVVVRNPEVVVSSMPRTKEGDGESVTNPVYFTCGLGEVATSVDGYLAWAQVNLQDNVTTETVQADTGGPNTLATAPIPATLTQLAFHQLAFSGETLTWLSLSQLQSAQLQPYPLAPSQVVRRSSRSRS